MSSTFVLGPLSQLHIETPLGELPDFALFRSELNRLISASWLDVADGFHYSDRFSSHSYSSEPDLRAAMMRLLDELESSMRSSRGEGYLYRHESWGARSRWTLFTSFGVGDDEAADFLYFFADLFRYPELLSLWTVSTS